MSDRFGQTARGACPLGLAFAAACATASGVPAPQQEWLIAAPPVDQKVDPVGLTHFMRGQLFRFRGQAAAAVPHFRLALLYASDSSVVHQRLAEAWLAVGDGERGRAALLRGLERNPDDPWLNLLAGDLATTEGRFDAAVGHLRTAAADDTVVSLAGPLLIDVVSWLGQEEAAAAMAEELGRRRPADAGMAIATGEALEDHGRLALGLASYRRAREQEPANRTAALGEARILMLLDRAGDAADGLMALFAHYPDDPGLYLLVARLLRQAGRPDAELYRGEAVRQAQGDPHTVVDIATNDLLAGQTAAGLATLRQAVVEMPTALGPRLFLADASLRLGSPHECIDLLASGALSAAAIVRQTRAACYGAAGELELALEQLTFALLETERPREFLLEAARLLSLARPQQEAAELLARLVERVRAAPEEARLAEAALAGSYGDTEAALATLARIPEVVSVDPELRLRHADLLARHGDLEAALELLSDLWRDRPADPIRLNALGFTLADAGQRLTEAEVYLRRAYRLAPEEGYVTDSLGWLFFRQGKLELAARLLLQATREAPGEAEILAHLAQVYSALGRSEAARAAMQAALDARPTPSQRWQFEALLAEMEGR